MDSNGCCLWCHTYNIELEWCDSWSDIAAVEMEMNGGGKKVSCLRIVQNIFESKFEASFIYLLGLVVMHTVNTTWEKVNLLKHG